jgi:hypothetical protein
MATKASSGRVRLAYKFIELHKHQYPVQIICEVLKVAPSGYYEWLHRPLSDRAIEASSQKVYIIMNCMRFARPVAPFWFSRVPVMYSAPNRSSLVKS